jgi:glycosyltransferase involved in cell wall biosynthesis
MIKAGLIVSLRGSWQGGVSYFRNLLECYRKYPDPGIKLEVFSVYPEDAAGLQSDAIAVHPWPELEPRRRDNYARRVARKLLGYDPVLLRLMEREGVNLLSHCSLGSQTRIDTLQWMPDFQHKRLPGFFSPGERANRDSSIAGAARWGNILLSSHAAASDFRRYYPELASVQAHVLHFSNTAILDVAPPERGELEAQYPVREPYFYLPNQFWQHKNHGVVLEALARTRPEIRVLCTGLMEDYRNPSYVRELMEKVKKAGLAERFVCLGSVPYPVLVGLMHHSLAVLQPSLFEGWSTTVEESRAMCKQIVLTNIDVHLEQAPERAAYFSPDSPDELAFLLERIYAGFSPDVEESFALQRSGRREKLEQNWIEEYARILKAVSGSGE